MKPVRVLIAEDNPIKREEMAKDLERRRNVQLVGAAQDGREALRLIRELSPQVLVCDMVMPQVDGFGLLERIGQMEPSRRPRIIAHTALSRDDFITRALEMGASYYMVKPVDMDLLVERIVSLGGKAELCGMETPPEEDTVEHGVANMLLEIGVPVHLSGYRFLLRSTLLALEHPDYLRSITHTLYPAVASYFSTTASRVERAIRHAINMTWERGGAAAFEAVLNRRSFSPNDRPTNCELIALLSEQARLHGWGKKIALR